MGVVKKWVIKIRQWEIGGKKLGSDPIQINNNNIFHNTNSKAMILGRFHMVRDTVLGRFFLQTGNITATISRHHYCHFPTLSLEHLNLSLRSNLALHSLHTLS
jgi:hypothetical protein